MSAALDPQVLWTWAAILGVAATTVITRCSFLALGERAKLPPVVERGLRYAPAAALAALVVPDVLSWDGATRLALDNPKLVGAAVAIAVFLPTRSMLATIAAGMAGYTVVRLWF
ncbi:MAG: AzlD domain-containing protein [Steroidobacteraceae bacterium]|jgi:branched-subunit amino acid transport protein|nr:AzlD domain-containing protein [Steroidobacteraceae bacterium]